MEICAGRERHRNMGREGKQREQRRNMGREGNRSREPHMIDDIRRHTVYSNTRITRISVHV